MEIGQAYLQSRLLHRAGRQPLGVGAKPFTGHGFHLGSVPEVIDTLRGAGLLVEHRRAGQGDDAPHLLIATPVRPPL